MILFKNNPDLGLQTKITVDGTKEYRCNCKLISGKYYRKDDQCFLINDTWYRLETGKIELDHETKKYVLKNSPGLQYGIVGFKDNEPVIGAYTQNLFKNCKVHFHGTRNCIDHSLLQQQGWVENIATCQWYDQRTLSASDIKHFKTVRNEVDHHRKGYNIEDNAAEFLVKKEHYARFPTKIEADARRYGKFLGDYTFGQIGRFIQ